MPIQIATSTDHLDLFDRLVAWLQEHSNGPGWELLRLNTQDLRALFRAPGLSGTEEIHFGFSVHANVSLDTYALGVWMFRSFNDAMGDLEQPGHSGVKYLPVWNTAIPYWFVANGQRLIVVAKVSTTYHSLYAGKFLPYGTPGEYPQPYYLCAPVTTSTRRWSTIVESDRSFFDPGTAGIMSLPNGQWRSVANFGGDASEIAQTGINLWPFQARISGGSLTSAQARYRELRENLDGSYPVWPLVILGSDPDVDNYGELDGAYAVCGFNSASENIVQIGGDDYLVVQNGHRTARYFYGAIKLT
jgi:hypothetical protein